MISRQIVYYAWGSVNTRPPFVPHDACGRLLAEIEADPDFAVMKHDDVTTAVTVVAAGSEHQPTKLELLALRSQDERPSQWKPGEDLAALDMPADWYPSDVTHVMIWPDGIAAQDLHPNAPRLGRLSHYFRQKVQAYVTFQPLYQPDMFERLLRLRGRLRRVEISMTRPEYLSVDRGAFGTLLPPVWGPRVPSASVHVGMGRRGPRDQFLDGAVEEDVFRIAEDAHDYVDRLVVLGKDPATNRTERVNLLGERLHEKVEIPARPGAPSLPARDLVYDGMADVYRKFSSENLFERASQAQATRPR
jgi:hypothetical protein